MEKTIEKRIRDLEELTRRHKEMLALQIEINLKNIEFMNSLLIDLERLTNKQNIQSDGK